MRFFTQLNMTTLRLIARVTFRANSADQASKMIRGEAESIIGNEALVPSPNIPKLISRLMRLPDVTRVQIQVTPSLYSVIAEAEDFDHEH